MNKKSRQGSFQKLPGTALGIRVSDEGLFVKCRFSENDPFKIRAGLASGFALDDLDHSANVGRRQDSY